MRQLRYFVAVARERNFTRAAEKLHIAQPPLSRQIQQLEDEFGVALIDRGSRPLALTDAGRLVFEQAVQVLDRMDEMKAMVARGCTRPSAAAQHRLRRLDALRLSARGDPALPRGAARCRAHAARDDDDRADRGAEGGPHRRRLRSHPLRRPGDRAHAAAQREALRRVAADAPLVVAHRAAAAGGTRGRARWSSIRRRRARAMRTRCWRCSANAVLKPAVVHEVRELQTALGLVAAESGVCLVPASVERLRRDNVVYRPLDEPGAVSPIIMSARKGRPLAGDRPDPPADQGDVPEGGDHLRRVTHPASGIDARRGQHRHRVGRRRRQRPAEMPVTGIVQHARIRPRITRGSMSGIIGRSPAQGTDAACSSAGEDAARPVDQRRRCGRRGCRGCSR